MAKCLKCGGNDWSVIEQVGAIETWRCNSCGATETMHVFKDLTPPDLAGFGPVYQVLGMWSDKPSMQQVSDLKGMIPTLRNASVPGLLRKAIEKVEIDLGRFSEADLRNLEPRLNELGMKIRQTQIGGGK